VLEGLLDFPLVQLPVVVVVKVLIALLHVGEKQVQSLELLEVNCSRAVAVMDPAASGSRCSNTEVKILRTYSVANRRESCPTASYLCWGVAFNSPLLF